MSDIRTERDSMGEMPVPATALYGASTQRAVLNFPVSHEPVEPGIVHAFGLIKWAAARVNGELGHVAKEKTDLIERAAQEVYEGQARRRIPGRCLPDRLRHLDQHECQRGHREPLLATRRRSDGGRPGRETRASK